MGLHDHLAEHLRPSDVARGDLIRARKAALLGDVPAAARFYVLATGRDVSIATVRALANAEMQEEKCWKRVEIAALERLVEAGDEESLEAALRLLHLMKDSYGAGLIDQLSEHEALVDLIKASTAPSLRVAKECLLQDTSV